MDTFRPKMHRLQRMMQDREPEAKKANKLFEKYSPLTEHLGPGSLREARLRKLAERDIQEHMRRLEVGWNRRHPKAIAVTSRDMLKATGRVVPVVRFGDEQVEEVEMAIEEHGDGEGAAATGVVKAEEAEERKEEEKEEKEEKEEGTQEKEAMETSQIESIAELEEASEPGLWGAKGEEKIQGLPYTEFLNRLALMRSRGDQGQLEADPQPIQRIGGVPLVATFKNKPLKIPERSPLYEIKRSPSELEEDEKKKKKKMMKPKVTRKTGVWKRCRDCACQTDPILTPTYVPTPSASDTGQGWLFLSDISISSSSGRASTADTELRPYTQDALITPDLAIPPGVTLEEAPRVEDVCTACGAYRKATSPQYEDRSEYTESLYAQSRETESPWREGQPSELSSYTTKDSYDEKVLESESFDKQQATSEYSYSTQASTEERVAEEDYQQTDKDVSLASSVRTVHSLSLESQHAWFQACADENAEMEGVMAVPLRTATDAKREREEVEEKEQKAEQPEAAGKTEKPSVDTVHSMPLDSQEAWFQMCADENAEMEGIMAVPLRTAKDTKKHIEEAPTEEAPTPEAEQAPTEEAEEAPTEDGPAEEAEEAPTADAGEIPAGKVQEAPTKEAEEVLTADAGEAPAGEAEKAPTVEPEEAPTTDVGEAPAGEAEEAPTEKAGETPTADAGEAPAGEAENGANRGSRGGTDC
nr:hypothetical protein BaRGS_002854 [Batillaria attramentaria]